MSLTFLRLNDLSMHINMSRVFAKDKDISECTHALVVLIRPDTTN